MIHSLKYAVWLSLAECILVPICWDLTHHYNASGCLIWIGLAELADNRHTKRERVLGHQSP